MFFCYYICDYKLQFMGISEGSALAHPVGGTGCSQTPMRRFPRRPPARLGCDRLKDEDILKAELSRAQVGSRGGADRRLRAASALVAPHEGEGRNNGVRGVPASHHR